MVKTQRMADLAPDQIHQRAKNFNALTPQCQLAGLGKISDCDFNLPHQGKNRARSFGFGFIAPDKHSVTSNGEHVSCQSPDIGIFIGQFSGLTILTIKSDGVFATSPLALRLS